jgi:hypothetical protein
MINEIAELLCEKSEQHSYPLEKPTIENLVEVQEDILISLPTDFREYMMNCSHVSYSRFEPVTIADPQSHTYLPEVAAEAWAQGLPREFIPLCVDGATIYGVAQDDAVVRWTAQDEEPEEICSSVWEWVRDYWLEGEI